MRIRLWNPAAERIFGWSSEEMIGRDGVPMAPPDRRTEGAELFARVLAGERVLDHETVRVAKNGAFVPVSIAAAPVRDASGRVVGNLVAYTDITERREQELRLQALIDSSPLALVEFGMDTRIRLWNPAAERIFGWTREEMVGRGGLPMAPPAQRAEAESLFTRVLAGEQLNDYETERLRKDGALVPVSIAAAPVRDGSGRVVGNLVAYTDISERKAQAAEVHRLNDELRARLEELAASRARIVTAGDVERRRLERNLHDGAQQRLVTLSLSLRLALARLETDPATARTVLEGASEELARALDELRELARGLHPAVLTDHGLRAAVETLAGRAPVPVEIAAIPAERLPGPVEAAAYYVIAEALTNVAKYAQAETVLVRVVASAGDVLVEVADDGAGGADPRAGSGLRGLADRVEAFGGTLEIQSPRGAGTTLRATIPRAS
jgi:PAS domain S-box-containing protein